MRGNVSSLSGTSLYQLLIEAEFNGLPWDNCALLALRKLGVEAELARYPGEGHGFRRPQHQLDYLRRALDWFDRHLRRSRIAASLFFRAVILFAVLAAGLPAYLLDLLPGTIEDVLDLPVHLRVLPPPERLFEGGVGEA